MKFRVYLLTMCLLLGAGVAITVMTTGTTSMALGLALITVGSGGLSAGLMSHLSSTKAVNKS